MLTLLLSLLPVVVFPRPSGMALLIPLRSGIFEAYALGGFPLPFDGTPAPGRTSGVLGGAGIIGRAPKPRGLLPLQSHMRYFATNNEKVTTDTTKTY
jgi:hypothetical protein